MVISISNLLNVQRRSKNPRYKKSHADFGVGVCVCVDGGEEGVKMIGKLLKMILVKI